MVRKLFVFLFILLSFNLALGQNHVYMVTGCDKTTSDFYYWENSKEAPRNGDSIQILVQDTLGNTLSARLSLYNSYDTLEYNISGEATIPISVYNKYNNFNSYFTFSPWIFQIQGELKKLYEFDPITHNKISYSIKKFVIVLGSNDIHQRPICNINRTYYKISSHKPLSSSEIRKTIQTYNENGTIKNGVTMEIFFEL